jgi:hypothetical protein
MKLFFQNRSPLNHTLILILDDRYQMTRFSVFLWTKIQKSFNIRFIGYQHISEPQNVPVIAELQDTKVPNLIILNCFCH